VATGFAIYGSYWLAVSSKLGGSGYEGLLLSDSGRLLTFAGLWSHVVAAFTTAYVQQPHLLPAWVLTACLLCWGAISRLGTAKQKLFILVIAFLLVAALPLLSLIYVNPAHIRDADRVLFPTSFGFVLVCISLLGRFRSDAVNSANTVAMIVFSSFFSALNSRKYVQIQEYVTTQTLVAVKDHHSKSVLVRDSTGILGDVYTLYETAFGDALAVLGSDIAATICTPLNVDRLHLVAQRFPLQSTRRCEELPVVPGELVLTARWQDGVLLLAPATQ
jgi:hypothetical protein